MHALLTNTNLDARAVECLLDGSADFASSLVVHWPSHLQGGRLRTVLNPMEILVDIEWKSRPTIYLKGPLGLRRGSGIWRRFGLQVAACKAKQTHQRGNRKLQCAGGW